MLFAQFNRNEKMAPEEMAVLLGFVCVILLIQYTTLIFFLLTLHRLLKKCRKRNRTMEPGLVWLNLIPCFQFVWQFITVVRIDETLRDEFRERGIGRRDDSYGKAVGLTSCIFWIVAQFFDKLSNAADRMNQQQGGGDDFTPLDIFAWILLVITLIFLVTYWVKMAGYSRQLSESNLDDDFDDGPRRRPRDDWDEDRDDRPRRRQSRDDLDEDREDRRRRRDERDDDDDRR